MVKREWLCTLHPSQASRDPCMLLHSLSSPQPLVPGRSRLSRAEALLLTGLLAAACLAVFGPAVAQYADYHAFADQRGWAGLPHAMDVLSNLPFAVFGIWGLVRAGQQGVAVWRDARWQLLALFFAGLVLTALCSAYYHWQPEDAALAIDRGGMVLAFAGLLGAAVADRVSVRMGVLVATLVLALGPMSVLVWSHSGNLLPWAVLQGGGMLLVVIMAMRRPVAGAWGLPLLASIGWYGLAKLLELADHPVYALSGGWVSGHSLKHVAAACAAWPVLRLMHNGAQHKSCGA